MDSAGMPCAVNGSTVAAVRENWEVEDRWWTLRPLRRRYFELATGDGQSLVIFRCEMTSRWYRQRA